MDPIAPTADDRTLIDAFRTGDEAAFAALHDRHHQAVAGAARRVLADDALAEEVAQEVLLDLWRRPWRFDPGRGSLASLLVVQSRSRAIDRVRSEQSRRAREQREATDASLRPDDGRSFSPDDRIVIHGAIATLEPDHRCAIELAFFQGFSYREVAELLGVAEGTVKSRIRRGLQLLRGALADADPTLLGAA